LLLKVYATVQPEPVYNKSYF